jgi:hypothetical protein
MSRTVGRRAERLDLQVRAEATPQSPHGLGGKLEVLVETMVGIAVLLVGVGVLWVCFALGVYLFTRTGREGIRIKRMEDELRQQPER